MTGVQTCALPIWRGLPGLGGLGVVGALLGLLDLGGRLLLGAGVVLLAQLSTARTTMGAVGVKVWVYLGEQLPGQPALRPELEGTSSRPRRGRNERRGR